MKKRHSDHEHDIDDARRQVSDSFQSLLDGAEELLRSTASYTGEEIDRARSQLKSQMSQARRFARDWDADARSRARRAALAADEYVHENAWKTVGLATLAGVVLGSLVALACNDHRRH